MMNEPLVTAEEMQKKFPGYCTKTVPQTCAHCRHLKLIGGFDTAEVTSCNLDKNINFAVVPLGTCNF